MHLKPTLSLQLRVTTQTVLSSHLLRLSEADLEEAIARALADNPALEASRSADRFYEGDDRGLGPVWRGPETLDAADDGESPDGDVMESVAAPASSVDRLIEQARLTVDAEQFTLVAFLIQCLDEHGFLRVPEEDLAASLTLPPERIAAAIAALQQLDPPGVGARNVRECLLLQCRELERNGVDCRTIRAIVERGWDDFVRQRWGAAARAAGCSPAEVQAAVRTLVSHFYLFPLLLVPDARDDARPLSRPDLIIRRWTEGDVVHLDVEVPSAGRRRLRINPAYERAARAAQAVGAAGGGEWAGRAVEEARLFIAALEGRSATLLRIGEYLLEYQVKFFLLGPRYLRPLTRAGVAHALELDPSTVSRAVSDKIVQLPDLRLVPLAELFDSSLPAKEAIREILAVSGDRLTDRELTERLRDQSFDLSRRTVAQYRDELRLPSSYPRSRAKTAAGDRDR